MRRTITSAAVTLTAALALLAADPPVPAVKLVTPKAGQPAVVEVTGLNKNLVATIAAAKLTAEEWEKVARLTVDDGTATARPPVAGTWTTAAGVLRFEPQFPLAPGQSYRLTCDLSAVPRSNRKGGGFALALSVPKPPPGPRVSVVAVYPSADRLPENTLRLYVQFSGRVKPGDVYRHVKLVRDDGQEVTHPFLEIDEELWSADGTRITLLFHPGRVKRGLKPREEDGPILEEGRRYTLTVSRDWADVDGRPLTAEFRKTFLAGPPDDQPVEPESWSVVGPRGGDAALIVHISKPLDHALLDRFLTVADAASNPVDGTLTVGGGERVVTFTPAKPWQRGGYKLVVDTRLEDVCGNRVGEPFEVDVFKPITRKIEGKTVERPFTVR